ncbi:MAG: OTU domain-containing protein [Pseudomonadota bacterium]
MSLNRRRGNVQSTTAAFNTLELVKDLLFSKVPHARFKSKMKSPDIETAVRKLLLHEEDERNLQIYLAPFLRAAAISHLRSANIPMAQEFREHYREFYRRGSITADLEQYLDYQARNYVWSTEVEAAALGSLFNMTVQVTEIVDGEEQTTHVVNRSTNANAPVLRMYYYEQVHWFFEPDNPEGTIGDGNCLFNAFALALRQSALDQQFKQRMTSDESFTLSPKSENRYKARESLRAGIDSVEKVSIQTMVKQIPEAKAEIVNEDMAPLIASKITSPDDTLSPIKRKEPIVPAQFIPLKKYDPQAANFYGELQVLIVKAGELERRSNTERNYKPAARVSKRLVTKLSQQAHLYFNLGKLSPNEFVTNSTALINAARPVLERYRGWKQVLANVALAIIGVGVGYLVAGIVHKALTGNFLFFKTDSAEKLDLIVKAVKHHKRIIKPL